MADKKEKPQPSPEAATSQAAPAKPTLLGRLRGLLKQNLIVAFICLLVLIHAALFAAWKFRAGPASLPNEVTLGEFEFEGEPLPGNTVRHAAFRLHVRLLDGAAYHGRALLYDKQHKLQQEIEQLLRQAHGADFEDPTLLELKRQFQAIVNKTLGERVVDEVIITDLSLERVAAAPVVPVSSAPEAAQWQEATSG
jgi:hypothetical protein